MRGIELEDYDAFLLRIKRAVWKHICYHILNREPQGICFMAQGSSNLVLCDVQEEWGGVGGGREAQEGRDMCIPLADSC